MKRKKSESALKISEKYGLLINDFIDPITVYSLKGEILLINNKGAENLGGKQDDFIGKSLYDLLPEMADTIKDRVQRIVKTGKLIEREDLLMLPSGQERWFFTRNAPIRSVDGKVIAIQAVSYDITERKRAEDEIKSLSARQEAILAAAPDIIMEVDKDKIYTWANKAGYLFFGDDVIGREASFYFIGRQETYRIVQPLFEGSDNITYVESWQRRRDGESRLLAWWCRVLKDSNGRVTGALSTARDITKQRIAEEALEENENKFRILFNQAVDSIFLMLPKDNDFIIVDINKSACDMHGYSREEIIGKSISFLDDPETARKIPERLKALMQGIPLRAEGKHMRKDGSIFPVEISAQVIHIANAPYILAIDRDITERKKAEEILKRDRETFEKMVQQTSQQLLETERELDKSRRLADIGILAARIAHELRNPLAAIQIAAYNIKKKRRDIELDKHIINIEKKVSESEQIINNLLFYARLKTAHYEQINISDFLKECVNSIEKRFSSQEVSVMSRLSDISGLIIEADPLQMKEFFNNILNNAYDAVSDRQGKIEVGGERVDSGHIAIHIKDNGVGIEAENLEKVYEPFFTTKSKGTGLGLTVCLQIAYLHDGAMDIKSKKGEWTKVTIVLPIKKK